MIRLSIEFIILPPWRPLKIPILYKGKHPAKHFSFRYRKFLCDTRYINIFIIVKCI